jgi:predicted house-cleaning noncanonical NTP pyrophosphatase (MazG superfamily)
MPIYNKLVRDKIPVIIQTAGKGYRTKQLSETEYIKELIIKINEEITEYKEARTDKHAIEELADVLEIIQCLAKVHGTNMEEIEKIRKRKAEERGSFEDMIFLIDMDDE